MRQKRTAQISIYDGFADHELGRELRAMSEWLDQHCELLDGVMDDLHRGACQDTGRDALSAESALRCALLKQHRQLSYEELAFHLQDSASFRAFERSRVCRCIGVRRSRCCRAWLRRSARVPGSASMERSETMLDSFVSSPLDEFGSTPRPPIAPSTSPATAVCYGTRYGSWCVCSTPLNDCPVPRRSNTSITSVWPRSVHARSGMHAAPRIVAPSTSTCSRSLATLWRISMGPSYVCRAQVCVASSSKAG